jgi:formylmethanofuran dehydrogenase subunit E
MPYRKAQWADDEVKKLEPTLRSTFGERPKDRWERYFDEKDMRYKYKRVPVEKVKCPECGELFYKKRPKQIFCQDFCRIRNWQRIHRKQAKIEKRVRIRQMWE